MQISVTFESDVAQAPAGFKACIYAVCQYYDALFTSSAQIAITVGWGTVGGQAIDAGNLGESSSEYFAGDYSQVATALKAQGAPGSATLPAVAPNSGQLDVNTAQARALGFSADQIPAGSDGAIGFDSTSKWAFDPTQSKAVAANAYDFVSTVEHEISEVMGRSSSLNATGEYSIMDLFRYQGAGQRQFGTGAQSYFSVDGGVTNLGNWNNFKTGDNGDLGDWAPSNRANDSYNDAGGPGVIDPVTAVDKTLMAAIGWTEAANAASLTVANAVPQLTAVAAISAIASGQDAFVKVVDSAAGVAAQLDGLQSIAAGQQLGSIALTDSGTPSLTLTAAQTSNDAAALADIATAYQVHISDSAADVAAALNSLQSQAAAGTLTSISLTDGGIPTLSITAAQLTSDAAALKDIAGYYSLAEAAPSTSATITGSTASLGNTVIFSGNAAAYSFTAKGDGIGLTIAGNGVSDALSNVQALQFADHTLIVAATPTAPGAPTISTGNITELYGAVFGRLPDVAGLSYYQQELAANPSLSLLSLAENFLQSPEYVNNSAHNYAQTTAGDTVFITGLYNNLLHRAPASGDAAWYEANVIAPNLGTATPGTAAYTSALLLAHAAVVTDFSASAEFLNDVTVTPTQPADATHWLVLI